MERIPACHCVRPVAIHGGEYLQPQYHAVYRHIGEHLRRIRHHPGPVFRRGRYGGTDGGTKGNVFRLEFPFQRPEGRFEAADPRHESARLKGESSIQRCGAGGNMACAGARLPRPMSFGKPLRAMLLSSLCAFLRKIFHKHPPWGAFSVAKQDRLQLSGSGLYAWDDGPSGSG